MISNTYLDIADNTGEKQRVYQGLRGSEQGTVSRARAHIGDIHISPQKGDPAATEEGEIIRCVVVRPGSPRSAARQICRFDRTPRG